MRKFIAIAMILALSACLMAGCRNRNTDTTMPSSTGSTPGSTGSTAPSSSAGTTAPSATPMPTATAPGTTGEGVLPDIADDLMPSGTGITDGSQGDLSRGRPAPRY